MDNRDAVSAFLRSRRDKITPEQAGLPTYGRRRVSGLRRGEVAALAGVSVEYYTRLERGSLQGVSDSVLDALARALRLDATERMYLYDLARAAGPAPRTRVPRPESRSTVRPSVARIVDGMPELPAYVMNNRLDALAANSLGRALYSEMYADPTCGANVARFAFFNSAARRFYTDWERMARFAVGALRIEAGKNPYDRELSNLIGELSTRSDAFRVMWGSHDVHVFRESTKRLNHPLVGELELDQETMSLPDESGLSVVVYSAPPETAAEDGLKLLASWSATAGQVQDA
ncbi:helix-turn-helix transcriptional regulator [Streptomyces sp. NBC_00582]|uniref:helix-turn-helix transcriptional regulator n=1 Tax=Streptomyces sp. NBC_00582 TaxID=2975783 RepID=UPI001064268D|nr:helix-turn-helix domain-containing protein [Streptomyces sp. NBC_00582]WUB59050.1 helix-turn-helix transcriptional regulator [Streptomyces sp. NBC_00582]WUB67678.1 helix-turn-helix transcriptional regulator [Streptomyces sp. NBC_00582]